MPQNWMIVNLFRPCPVEKPLPADLLQIEVIEPTVIATGAGTYYGYYHLDETPLLPSNIRLRISDTTDLSDANSPVYNNVVNFINIDWGYTPRILYGIGVTNGLPYPRWVKPPYGQLKRRFISGLSLLSAPPGLATTIYYTIDPTAPPFVEDATFYLPLPVTAGTIVGLAALLIVLPLGPLQVAIQRETLPSMIMVTSL
jgi:hypothetical protein